jgi:hypothetical protein
VTLSAIGGITLALLGLFWAGRDPGLRPRALVLLATGTLYFLGLAPSTFTTVSSWPWSPYS